MGVKPDDDETLEGLAHIEAALSQAEDYLNRLHLVIDTIRIQVNSLKPDSRKPAQERITDWKGFLNKV